MARGTSAATRATCAPAGPALAPQPAVGRLTLVKYASRLSIHALLLAFAALVLPRSTFLFTPLPPPRTSQDRPEPAFVRPLSAYPALTVAWIAAGAALLVLPWAQSMRVWAFDERTNRSDAAHQEWIQARPKAWRDAALSTLAAAGAFHILLVLFGAPITSYHGHTFLLALLLSWLTAWTPAFAFGMPTFSNNARFRWTRIFCEFMPRTGTERSVLHAAVGTVLGAWVGAFPIALDWDRPWQAWPLTPAFGAIFGYIAGSGSGLAVNVIQYLASQSIQHASAQSKRTN